MCTCTNILVCTPEISEKAAIFCRLVLAHPMVFICQIFTFLFTIAGSILNFVIIDPPVEATARKISKIDFFSSRKRKLEVSTKKATSSELKTATTTTEQQKKVKDQFMCTKCRIFLSKGRDSAKKRHFKQCHKDLDPDESLKWIVESTHIAAVEYMKVRLLIIVPFFLCLNGL